MVVLIDQPLRTALHKPDTVVRMAKWALELTEFDFMFQPRPSIKVQVLALSRLYDQCIIPDEEPTKAVAQQKKT